MTRSARAPGLGQRLDAVHGAAHLVALGAQGATQHVGDRLVVLDHEDTRRRCDGFDHFFRLALPARMQGFLEQALRVGFRQAGEGDSASKGVGGCLQSDC